jgi:Tfp pilus assembly protein PilF
VGYARPEAHRRKARRNLPMIRRELEASPRDPSLLMSLADTLLVLGERRAAREVYHTITTTDEIYRINADVFVQAHVNLALLYLREGDHHEARRYLYRTLYIDPTRIEAWFHLGAIAQRKGDEAGALELFVRSARTTPPLRMTAVSNDTIHLEAIARIGDILTRTRRYVEAERVLRHAIPRYPGAYRLHALLGRVHLDRMRLREAADCFSRSLAIHAEGNEMAFSGMARIYELLGDEARAEAYRHHAVTPPTAA